MLERIASLAERTATGMSRRGFLGAFSQSAVAAAAAVNVCWECQIQPRQATV